MRGKQAMDRAQPSITARGQRPSPRSTPDDEPEDYGQPGASAAQPGWWLTLAACLAAAAFIGWLRGAP